MIDVFDVLLYAPRAVIRLIGKAHHKMPIIIIIIIIIIIPWQSDRVIRGGKRIRLNGTCSRVLPACPFLWLADRAKGWKTGLVEWYMFTCFTDLPIPMAGG